jgi:hypothetical protein
MANGMRGEVPFVLDGRRHALVLTLGGLAALEQALAGEGLAGLAERLSSGRLSVGDALAVISAGLAGAGNDVSPDALGRAMPAEALHDVLDTAARLLAASFGGGSPSRPPPPQAAS